MDGEKCLLGLDEGCRGRITKGADGAGVAHSVEEWAETCRGVDGEGVSHSVEEHAAKCGVKKNPHKKQTSRAKEKAPRWRPTDSQLTKLRESYAREVYPTRKVKEAFTTQFGCTFDHTRSSDGNVTVM